MVDGSRPRGRSRGMGPTDASGSRSQGPWRRLALVLAALAVLLILVLMVSEPWRVGHPRRLRGESSSRAPSRPELVVPGESGTRSAAEPSSDGGEGTPAVEVSAPDGEHDAIEGVLRVFDGQDRAHEDQDGSFLLTADDEPEGRAIEVHGGRWRASLRAGTKYQVEDLLAGGRRAVPVDYDLPRRASTGEGWEIVARWTRSTVLVVRGQDTGLDLSGVDVAADVPRATLEGGHPGDAVEEHWIVRSARSPLEIPP